MENNIRAIQLLNPMQANYPIADTVPAEAMSLSNFFIDVSTLPADGYGFFQLLTLGGVYGYILFNASNLISDGSELLLLVPTLAGLVGSVVLPILGAVPDGCIVLFSGMGPNAAEELAVGIGALAGSTIMLLTIPWCLSIIGGRVDIDQRSNLARYKAPKLSQPDQYGFSTTGVVVTPNVNTGAKIMMATAVGYVIIQIPGLVYLKSTPEVQAQGVSVFALITLTLCISFFLGYLYYQFKLSGTNAVEERVREDVMIEAITTGKISLLGVMQSELIENERLNNATQLGEYSHLNVSEKSMFRLKNILKPFFYRYDCDGNESLDSHELSAVFVDLGEKLSLKELTEVMKNMDSNMNGTISFDEFVRGMYEFVVKHKTTAERRSAKSPITDGGFEDDPGSAGGGGEGEGEEGGEREEERDEVPDDLSHLAPEEQQRRIKYRAAFMLGLGTLLVVLISDPMVSVLSEVGKRTGISPFYISFIFAPLASNASEVIASYKYALKKTSQSITISMSALEGAAVMNNTFVLGIFMLIIFFKELTWTYFAETASILFVIGCVGLMALKKTHTVIDGLLILSLYPISLLVVMALEAVGWN